MRRRRQNLYVRQKVSPGVLKTPSRDTFPSSGTLNSNRPIALRVPAVFNRMSLTPKHSYKSADATNFPELKRMRTAVDLKRALIRISGLNAVISWSASVLGFLVISGEDDNSDPTTVNYLKLGMALISIFQATLVAVYWRYNLKYMEVVKTALKVSRDKVFLLRKSPAILLHCFRESAFQMIVFIPWVNFTGSFTLFGIATGLSFDDFIYVFVLLRNYHTVRFLYWYSHFSDVRTFMYTRIIRVDISPAFLFRCFLAEHGLKLLILIFVGMTLVYGLLVFAVEEGNTDFGPSDVWNKIWVVAYTDATIGYGDAAPKTFFGQIAIICCCFWGIFIQGFVNAFSIAVVNLNLTECSMYSELLYTREKTKYSRPAVLLIQDWWRFMLMRKHKTPHGFTVIAFYSQLRVYRGSLVKCQLVNDHRFERQIFAFTKATSNRFRALNEYLSPITYSESLVHST